jgi:hypothetical protein
MRENKPRPASAHICFVFDVSSDQPAIFRIYRRRIPITPRSSAYAWQGKIELSANKEAIEAASDLPRCPHRGIRLKREAQLSAGSISSVTRLNWRFWSYPATLSKIWISSNKGRRGDSDGSGGRGRGRGTGDRHPRRIRRAAGPVAGSRRRRAAASAGQLSFEVKYRAGPGRHRPGSTHRPLARLPETRLTSGQVRGLSRVSANTVTIPSVIGSCNRIAVRQGSFAQALA